MNTINTILLIITICYLFNAIRLKNLYVNYYNEFESDSIVTMFGHFLGTFIACCVEGICWWYVIKTILEN